MSDTYGGTGTPSGDQPAAQPGTPAPRHYGSAQPAPYQQPYGQQPYGVPPAGATPPGYYPYGEQPYGQYAPHLYGRPGFGPPGFGARDPNARPGTVLAAGIVTIVLSGMATLVLGITLAVGIALQATIAEELEGQDILGGGAGVVLATILGLLTVWSIGAILLAAFALRRSERARITLVVSSGLTIAASVVMIVFGGLLAVFSLLGAIAVIVLLFTGGAGEWYAGRHDRDESAPVY
jgi:hypothetical protein